MRRSVSTLVFAMTTCCAALAAQVPTDRLVLKHLPSGIAVALPSDWVPVGDSVARVARGILDTLLLHSRDSLVQRGLRNGKPIVLLEEYLPRHSEPSANLNVAPSPGATANAFGAIPPAAVIAGLAPLCAALRDGIRRLGARVLKCGPAQLDYAAGRTIAVTRMVRSGPSGFVTVWLAQYPDRDVIYTLTLSAPAAEAARYRPLFQRIWRSVTIGPQH